MNKCQPMLATPWRARPDVYVVPGSALVSTDYPDHRLPRLSSEFYLFGEPVTPVFIDKRLNKINSNNNITALVVPSS